MSTNQITWGKPQGNQAFGKSYTRQVVPPPSEIKTVIDNALVKFTQDNMFKIPPQVCQQIVSSFNGLE